LDAQPPDFHQRAAEETLAVLDMLKLDRVALWGHSDGAVIALRAGLMAPERVRGIVAEATHFFRRKPRSREFFETMRDAPDTLGERVVASLKGDHGDRWRTLIMTNGSAWLRIADEASSDRSDLYDGRLRNLQVPVLVIHGAQDPRTESGEVSALCAALDSRSRALCQASRVVILADGGHSPHSERATADRVTRDALDFLVRLRSDPKEAAALARSIVGPEP
jgi:pimeloyl-ACP methyl ester carboxylesterase